jgi:hypothetical protein
MMRRLAPALSLFFLAPLVAEFLLGDFPITLLPLVLALAPLYGGAGLLIREVARRTRRGWPTIVVLALAFGVFEEGLLTQSLFNPDYAGVHLLVAGFVPALGIAIPWTIFVLTLHTVWSISTPIALVEESTSVGRTRPWLGGPGIVITALLFVAGSITTFATSYGMGNHFLASPVQLGVSAAIVVVLVVIALRFPRVSLPNNPGRVPQPWLAFAITIVAGVLFMEGGNLTLWLGVAVVTLTLAGMTVLIMRWSARSSWGNWQRYGLAAGALLTYSWHAFTSLPVISDGGPVVDTVSHIIFAVAALGILWLVAGRIRAQENVAALSGSEPPSRVASSRP